jgi:hypothetical protein
MVLLASLHGHYDAERYKKGIDNYKRGKIKSHSNWHRWCKIRSKRAKGQAQSDLKVLMVKYNFTRKDINEETRERKMKIRQT